ncbi:geranylgeranyl pyrophosphate synthetase [Grosmannia clavigera kw1407]|uniref:Geranylgeranyl pyrophosphate synthetase n=1 Tax=Grosmannia clavigera (strain kw1407 / UAMH 11150) TaxID=655863 RepID=F0XKN6_GROCL|nr:geranylgeranyl pyrophosphate synthetase [Grosmannia clavigera kw1407]EFX01641.1 geranylgeranyl pyrophosphate synthetase [Grosmannia clavigera kw1407]
MSWSGSFSAQQQRGSTGGKPSRGRGNFQGRGRGGFSRGGYLHDSQEYRGRGNKRGSWRDRSGGSEPPLPPLPTGPLIERLRAVDLDFEAASFEDAAVISAVEPVASFSWMKADRPTIMIPGMPPRWSPPAAGAPPPVLSEDNGAYFRDINAGHYAAHPMEPTVVAGLAADPSLPRSTDIVACGSTLGSLLRFLRGDDKPFRMLAEIVTGSLFLVRRERSPTELLQNVYGYGHSFPEAYTTWDPRVRGSTSHQRLIRYSFGHLDLAVRYEVDGYLEDEEEQKKRTERQQTEETASASSVDDLVAGLDGLSTAGSNEKRGSPSSTSALTVVHGGSPVDRRCVIDIKTRSERKRELEDTIALELPRLWVRQIDNFVLAYHVRGTFHDVQVLPVRDRVRAWERHPEQRPALRRLAALLHRLVAATRTAPDQRLEIVFAGRDSSHATSQNLPDDHAYLELHAQLPGTEDTLSAAVGEQWDHGLSVAAWLVEDSTASDGPESPVDKQPLKEAPLEDGGKGGQLPTLAELVSWEDGSEDFTGCSAACGYCGECAY